MNTYDPADYIVYVVLAADAGPVPAPPAENRLPRGYANQSPHTSLRVRGTAGPDDGTPAGVAVLPGRAVS